jgi:hypothetical protein
LRGTLYIYLQSILLIIFSRAPEEEIDYTTGKQLIEEQEVFNQVTNKDDYVLLDQSYRIEAPPKDDDCCAFIFWTKDSPDDESQPETKIVSCLNLFLA